MSSGQVSTSTEEIGAGENVHVPTNEVLPDGGLAPLRHWPDDVPACVPRSGRTPDTPDWPKLPPSGRKPSRSSRQSSEPPDPRLLNGCEVDRAGDAAWSRRISQPPVGDTRREWYRVWRCARLAAVLCVLTPADFRQCGPLTVGESPAWLQTRLPNAVLAARYSFCSRSCWFTQPVT
jgi:hypothetical protein